jgi:chromosome segregation ATPase
MESLNKELTESKNDKEAIATEHENLKKVEKKLRTEKKELAEMLVAAEKARNRAETELATTKNALALKETRFEAMVQESKHTHAAANDLLQANLKIRDLEKKVDSAKIMADYAEEEHTDMIQGLMGQIDTATIEIEALLQGVDTATKAKADIEAQLNSKERNLTQLRWRFVLCHARLQVKTARFDICLGRLGKTRDQLMRMSLAFSCHVGTVMVLSDDSDESEE